MTDIPKNMVVFNLVTLRIFDRLYEAFPQPIEITPGTIGFEITDDDTSSEEAWDVMSIAESTLPWLATEGFLRYNGVGSGGRFHEVQLTLKGLAILGSVPASVNQSEIPETMIKKIKRVLSIGAEKTGEDAVKTVLNEVFKLALKASASVVSSGLINL